MLIIFDLMRDVSTSPTNEDDRAVHGLCQGVTSKQTDCSNVDQSFNDSRQSGLEDHKIHHIQMAVLVF